MTTTTIGGLYQLHEQIGIGGMGTVYRGIDLKTNTEVAVKMLKPEAVQQDRRLIERFRREGEALRTLNHPNMVKMLDVIDEDDTHYLIMEYVPSGDLSHLLQNETLSIHRTINIALDIADALTRAHRLNVIHRDLKPGNVLIAEDGTPRLTDFGVAHIAQKERVTETNAIVGTIDYLSPEALNEGTMDTRSDIWAFGVMLYEMLAGERPFKGDSVGQIVMQILTQPLTPLDELRSDVPVALVDLVHRMLEKDPNMRISSVRIVGAELEALLSGTPLDTSSITPAVPVAVQGRFADSTPMGTTALRHNLPIQSTPFIGREAELLQLDQLLSDSTNHLVTILASGGMGKTRLSIEAAARQVEYFPDGVHFVELAPLNEASAIPSAIGHKIGFQISPAPIPAEVQLANFLREKSMLLVLDNFEHVLDGTRVVSTVMREAPGIQFLATSREKLNLSGEAVFNLGGMDFPQWETPEDALEYSAVQMFMQSARRVVPGYELHADDLNYIARICQLVQGLPLGILLAAAWLDTLSAQEIAEEIDASMDFLESELRDLPERQRSIRAVFEYSWNLMPPADREVFSKLAVFRGGFDRQAAQKVANASLRNLTSLVNKSLITRDANSGRYTIHELVRQFAEDQLEQAGELEAMRDAHATYFSNMLEGNTRDLEKLGDIADRLIKPNFENIRVAWNRLCDEHELDALQPMLLPIYYFSRGYMKEYDGILMFKYARAKLEVPIEEAKHTTERLIWTHFVESEPDVMERLDRAAAVAERDSNVEEQEFIYFSKAVVQLFMGAVQPQIAIESLQKSIDFSRKHNLGFSILPAMYYMIQSHTMLGDYDGAWHWTDEMESAVQGVNSIAKNNLYLFRVYLSTAKFYINGDDSELIHHLQHMAEATQNTNDDVRHDMGMIYEGFRRLQHGELNAAKGVSEQILANGNEPDRLFACGKSYALLGLIALVEGHVKLARERLTQAKNVLRDYRASTEVDYGFALLHLIDGDYEAAKNTIKVFISDSVTCPVRYKQKFGEVVYYTQALLPILAAIAQDQGKSELAAELLGADSQRPFTHRYWAEDLAVLGDVEARVRTTLGDGQFNEAYARGQKAKVAEVFSAVLAD